MKITLKGNQMVWISLFLQLSHATENQPVEKEIASKGVLDLRQEFSNTLPYDSQKECTLELIQRCHIGCPS